MVSEVGCGDYFNNQIKITVVIPLYNGERYIVRSLDSVLRQTQVPQEIFVVNDGSTDAGVQLVKSTFGNKVKLLEQRNRGVSAARNAGIEASSGDWIAFLDADDVWLPNHLEELSRQVALFPHAAMLATKSIQLGVNETPPEVSPPGRVQEIDYLVEASKRLSVVNSSCVAIRKDVFNSIGDFKSYRYGEDLEMWARVALHYPVAVSDCVTSIYYRGTGGAIDRLQKQKGKKRAVKSIQDLSPAIKMLCDEGRENDKSSQIYIRSILKMMVKQDVIGGDVERARALLALTGAGYKLKMMLQYGLFLPESVIKKMVWVYLNRLHFFKSVRRMMTGRVK